METMFVAQIRLGIGTIFDAQHEIEEEEQKKSSAIGWFNFAWSE